MNNENFLLLGLKLRKITASFVILSTRKYCAVLFFGDEILFKSHNSERFPQFSLHERELDNTFALHLNESNINSMVG